MNANNQHSSSSNTDYNYEDARLRATVLWLIVRIYGGDDNQLPDSLRKPFKQDSQGRLALTTPVEACLTNGSFYCQAASRIFKDNSILTNNIGSVFHALAQAGIDVRDGEGASVTEPMLTAQSPFNTQAHMHLIDALMTAHLRAVVSIEKVVQAISSYTAIEKREEPLDCVDSLLFWINKVCLLVRDDVERNGLRLAGADSDEATIPEMEDLYEELCDGTCICTLASFYRPNELSLQEIRFKDQMSVADCRFNLELLKRFCSAHLPWDPFHFAIDDLLYLHESLQPNVNAFLADLFHFFELTAAEQCQPVDEPEPAPSQPTQHRRFVPIQPIPDLRGVPAKLGGGGVASKMANARLGLDKRDRAMSAASEESMMTGTTLKSRDSLCFASPRQPRLDPSLPVTHFGAVQPATPSTLSAQNQPGIGHNQPGMGLEMEQQQQREGGTGLAQIRLHMEQMKRSLSRRQQLESAQQEQQRNEASKDAFFRVMSRSAHNGLSPQTTPLNSNRLAEQSGEGTSLQQQLQQLPGQFNSQLNMAMLAGSGTSNANVNNSSSHYDQPQQTPMLQQQALMARSTMQLNQQQQMNQPMAFQGAGLQYPLQTSTPQSRQQQQLLAQQQQQNQLQHNHSQQHYAIPQQHQQQNLSPIGPPPPGSFHYMSSGSNEASFQHTPDGQGQAVQLHQQQQMMVPHSLPHFPGGGHYFPQQQQNFTPIPNGPAPVYQHQLAMAGHQQLQPQPFNVYSGGIPNGNYGGPVDAGQQLYFSPNAAGTGYQLARQPAGQIGPLQPSFSQPSHLHLLHQQQQQGQGGGGQFQQQPMLFQTPSGYQQQQAVQQGGYGGGGGVPMPMAQQHPFGGSSATMFASTETLVLPQQLNSSNGQQMVQQQQPATIVEEPSPFRLHQTNAPASRLDPQLELNKDLTNWGMTYRAGDRPQRKTWAEKRAEHEQQQQLANNSPPNAQNNNNNNNSSSSSDPLGAVAMPAGPFISGIATANSTPEREQQQQLVMMTSSQMSGGNNEGSMSARAGGTGTGVLLEDASEPNTEMTPEMQARRRALLASQLRRKERIVAKSEEKDATTESLERRHTELAKLEQAEQRKVEREVRRQKLLEDYKRKKMEQELGESPTSARSGAAGSGGATTSSTTTLNRGHSQPPFGRPKSQSNLNLIHSGRSTLQRPGRTQSNMMGSQNGGEEENMTPRVPSSIAGEPQLKLFAKAQPKSNRSLIMNALQYSIFPGHVSNENRQKAQAAIATSDSKHFLVLFRDHRLQYRAIYTWDQFSDTVHKIEGMGPKVCREPMMSLMFKYDSGAKSFGPIPTKHLSATIDGFVIADQYWQKPKIPHSGR